MAEKARKDPVLMNKNKLLVITIAVLVVGAGIIWVQAQSTRYSGFPEQIVTHQGQRIDVPPNLNDKLPYIPDSKRLLEAGATPQQIEALRLLGFEQQDIRIDLQAAVDKAEVLLERMLSDAVPADAEVTRQVELVNQARSALFKHDIDSRLKIKRILNADVMRKL